MQKNISHLGMLVCLGSMLTGCGIYTKYQQPEVQTDGLFGTLPEEVDITSSGGFEMAGIVYRRFFATAY